MEIKRMFVTGDTHGERARFTYFFNRLFRAGDVLFICGDFGYIFDDNESERAFLDEIAQQKYTVCFVDGNHENFPAIFASPEMIWNGGRVHKIRNNIFHLMRGEIYQINRKRILVFGGAYSIDKAFRTEGRSWWPQEMPTEEEYENARKNIEEAGNKVDYILTHAAPEETMCMFHPHHSEEMKLNIFLEWIRENVDYMHWYMGHLHRDEDVWRNQSVLWFDIKDMETNESIF